MHQNHWTLTLFNICTKTIGPQHRSNIRTKTIGPQHGSNMHAKTIGP